MSHIYFQETIEKYVDGLLGNDIFYFNLTKNAIVSLKSIKLSVFKYDLTMFNSKIKLFTRHN